MMKEFEDLVKADAAQVSNRQETDSVDIIDDIRFHITNFVQTYGEMEDANEKLKLIDDFLERIDIDA